MKKLNIAIVVVVAIVIIAAAVFALTYDSSQYETEDAKLKEYALQTQASIREGLHDANLTAGYDDDPVDRQAFAYVADYIDLYQNEIDPEKLTPDARIFYEESLVSLRPYVDMADAVDDVTDWQFEQAYEFRGDPEEQFLRVVMDYYGVTEIYEDYDPIEEFK